MGADEVLQNCVMLGVSAVELRSQPVETFLGGPPPRSGNRNKSNDVEGATKAPPPTDAISGAEARSLISFGTRMIQPTLCGWRRKRA